MGGCVLWKAGYMSKEWAATTDDWIKHMTEICQRGDFCVPHVQGVLYQRISAIWRWRFIWKASSSSLFMTAANMSRLAGQECNDRSEFVVRTTCMADDARAMRRFMSDSLPPSEIGYCRNIHRVREKKRPQFSPHNFDKFRRSFIIFGTNHPENSFY